MKKLWVIFFTFICLTLWADIVLERKTKISYKDTIGKTKMWARQDILSIKGQNLKIEDKTFGNVLIIRGDKKVVWKIDKLRNTYSELSFDNIALLKNGVIDEIEQAKATVEGSDEEKQLGKILSEFGDLPADTKVEMQNLTDTETIAGVKCERKKVLVGGRVIIDGFFAGNLPDGENYFKALASVDAFPKIMIDWLAKLKGTMLKGVVRYTLFSDRVVEEFETSSISRNEINPKFFDLPQGLTKVTLIGFEKDEHTKKEALVHDGSPPEADENKIPLKQLH